MFSNTVSFGKMLVRWNERAMPMPQILCGATPVMSRPSRHDLAAVGLQVAGDQIEERRLARAVRADDGGDRRRSPRSG